MLVVLKIPIVYLCVVVWWAIRAEPPHPPARDDERGIPALPPAEPCDWHGREGARRRRAALRRRPARRPAPRPGLARAEGRP